MSSNPRRGGHDAAPRAQNPRQWVRRGRARPVLLAVLWLALAGGAARAAQAGDTVAFGRYSQGLPDASGASDGCAVEPILWRVLEAGEDGLLLVSESVLDVRPYQAPLPAVAWRDCTLRAWLNDAENGFLAAAFAAEEMAALRPAETGEGVTDWVFCLSLDEATRYLPEDADRAAATTDYSASRTGLHADYWWLRTPPGGMEGFAAYVCDRGMVFPGTHHVFYELGVRPALWVNPSAIAGE